VPLFERQIRAGGPITVTHPDIERFFTTIRKTVQLVLQASALGAGRPDMAGRMFVLDMGQPVKIADLARQMIRLAGLRPERDVAIQFNGLRPGEKLFEELFHGEEQLEATPVPRLNVGAPRGSVLGRARFRVGGARGGMRGRAGRGSGQGSGNARARLQRRPVIIALQLWTQSANPRKK